jgi:hypothetical protein
LTTKLVSTLRIEQPQSKVKQAACPKWASEGALPSAGTNGLAKVANRLNERTGIVDSITKEYYERVKLTHAEQVNQFGWCMCDDGKGHIAEGCPTEKAGV